MGSRLGDIANLHYGKMPDKSLLGTGAFHAFSGYQDIGAYPVANVPANTLVVVARGVGGTGDVKYVTSPCYLTNLSIAIELEDKLISRYLYWNYFINGFNHLRSGSAQPQITISDLSNEVIHLPSRDEMKKRIVLLDGIDKKIAVNSQINDYLAVRCLLPRRQSHQT